MPILATGGALALRGARRVSVFAHHKGMKFTARTGDIQSEAQHGDLKLSASGAITLSQCDRPGHAAPAV